jgi:uncharacterized protein (DUF305 family)
VQTKRLSAALAAALAAVVTLSACNGSGTETQASATTPAAPPAATSPSASDSAHNDADVTFAQGMIPHHQQAVEMSDTLLAKQGIDPKVVSLAKEIKAAQAPEIEQMQGWLSQWGVSTTTTSPGGAMPSMPGHDMSGNGEMPGMSGGHGMMSEQDTAALQNAQGVEASRLFLSQMIQHHQGAIAMAQAEIGSGQFPPAITLARSIVSSQQQEITTMQGMLETL